MFRIAALNESGSSEGSQGDHYVRESTKEAKEAEAFALYHKALGLLRNSEDSQAESVFRDLIDHDFLQEGLQLLEEKGQDAIHPGLQLGYSIQKNLAVMATRKKNFASALESYLEAVKIDSSEVTVWYKMGMVALKLEDFQLAKLAFEQGLEYNPRHWPCLDNIITLMYALNNYMECCYFISQAFGLQVQYEKGYALLDKIFREQPSMARDTEEFFELCDPEVFHFHLDDAVAKEYVEEALTIRRRRQELSKPPEPERLNFPSKMKEYSWKHIGEVLIKLFDTAINAEPRISVCLKVNMPDYTEILPETKELKETSTASNDKNPDTPAENDVEMKEEVKSTDNVPKEVNPEDDAKEAADLVVKTEDNQAENNDQEKMEVDLTEQEHVTADQKQGVVEMHTGSTDVVKEENLETAKVTIEMTKEEAGLEIKDKVPFGNKITGDRLKQVIAEDTDSVMEAINAAHTLLDSLSPVKSSGPHSNSQPEAVVTSVKEEVEFPKITETEPTPKSEVINDNRQVSRATSLGFSVATILTPDVQCDKNVASSEVTKVQSTDGSSAALFTSTPVTDAPTKTETSVSMTSQSEVLQTQTTTTSQSVTSAVTVNPSTLLTNAPIKSLFASTPASIDSAISHSESQQSDLPLVTGSKLPSQGDTDQLGTNQLVTMATINSSRQSDHGYSKSCDSMPTNDASVLKPQNSGGFVPGYVNLGGGEGAIPIVQSLQRSSVAMDTEDKSPGQRKAQKRRRISATTEEIMMYGKRRSARVSVRNTGKKKEEETVNFYELLQAFLPSTLKTIPEEEDSILDTTKDDSSLPDTTSDSNLEDQSESMETSLDTWDEETEVRAFLDQCQRNQGLAHMMRMYLLTLAKHCKVKWNEAVRDKYLGIFRRIRKSMYVPNVFNNCDSDKDFQIFSQLSLVMIELQLDKWLASKNIVSPSSPTSQVVHDADIPACFDEDVLTLSILCSQSDRLGSLWIDHSIRVYWMKARYSMLRGRMEEAVACFEHTCEYLEYGKEEEGVQQVILPNCAVDNIINIRVVRGQQDLLQKNCSGEETQRWYEQGEYEKVVELLLQSFTQPAIKSKMVKLMSDPGERRSQLTLLQEALFKTGDYKRCIVWGEESFHEAYQSFLSSSSSQEQTEWVKTMVVIFQAILRALSHKLTIVQSLPQKKLMRFAQNLMKVIDSNMSLPENVTDMAVDTVLPWILLYHILKDEEVKLQSLRLKESHSSDDPEDEAMSSSHMLLNIAHDYLGSRSWCTRSDGALLQFFMSVLRTRMEAESRFQEEYQQAFEQCVYCLYGHPNKKGKAKHLQDHNAPAVTLQWKEAVQVFDYFKPKSLPEFDGYRSETISSEIEFLLKRITPLITEKFKSRGLTVEDIQNYIEGNSNLPPTLAEESEQDMSVVGEIYYLLGDYYLKNKETLKAIKFYLQDVCINPTRLDSWAGMALARMSQLDSKLTSADLKMDAPIYKKSIMALRCFKRATEIDDTNVKLWIEYGTLAYQMHSHACRQMKWKKWFAMDTDTVGIALESKREMLQTALNCFKKAGQCQRDWSEDEWLHTYMHGKCYEKLRKPIHETADFYFKTLEFLHEDGAKYPKKIVFSYTTPHLAVEALEMYYRIHSLILKTLLKHETGSEQLDYRRLTTFLLRAAQTPFARRREKGQGSRVESESCSSADENSCSTSSLSLKKKTTEKLQIDHTYYRQKSNHSNQGEEITADPLTVSKSVTTLELHSEGDPVLTTTTTTNPCPGLPAQESKEPRETTGLSPGKIEGEKTVSPDQQEVEIRELLKKMTDIVEAKVSNESEKESVKTENVAMETVSASGQSETSPVAMDTDQPAEKLKEATESRDEVTQEERLKEATELLLAKPVAEIHRELVDKCRQAFELCLRRFPTHYKSHYRLAYLYMNSPYHKNLMKAHHILLGSPKWQQLDYMPCQGLFGERKQTKFFQGIWKIPIDEIDRSGSFPSHLNRCIELTLQLLKDEKDSQTLHQVHLQLNRQPEPGKKYLRDAEKKYYALTSHRYTLDAIEMQIEDMKKMSDPDVRLRFLMNVYKVREHGVNKLNKHKERTDKLLAEAYRVVLRKLETLPHEMLRDQALRYCIHQHSQKVSTKSGVVAQPIGASPVKSSRPLPMASPSGSGLTPASIGNTQQNLETSSPKPSVSNASLTQTAAVATTSKVPERTSDDDVVEISDGSNAPTETKKPETAAEIEAKAPTVKIKMGLLQAVKRLKPTTGEVMDSSADERMDKPLFSDFSISAASEEESEVPLPSSEKEEEEEKEGSDSSSSSTSSSSSESSEGDSSSSSSSSESDDDDDDDDENVGKKGKEQRKDNDDSDDDDDDDGKLDRIGDDTADDKGNTTADESAVESGQVTAATTDDDGDDEAENESSDDDDDVDEVDLLESSDNDDKDDDKDKDYNASEDDIADEDVIMISDEEFGPKGRAVIPSPPHKNVSGGVDKEILVESIPDFNPLIHEMISSGSPAPAIHPVPVGQPIPVGQPVMSNSASKAYQKASPKMYEVFTIDSD